jgi:hypothetical protein
MLHTTTFLLFENLASGTCKEAGQRWLVWGKQNIYPWPGLTLQALAVIISIEEEVTYCKRESFFMRI